MSLCEQRPVMKDEDLSALRALSENSSAELLKADSHVQTGPGQQDPGLRKTLYFVRHGKSIGNELDIMGGWTDVPLSPAGLAELAEFKEKVHYPQADCFYHSGLTRAKDTLNFLYPGRLEKAREDWRFSESFFGILEGKNLESDFLDRFFRNFYHDIPQGYGEETFAESSRRVAEASLEVVDRLIDEKLSSALIFCHYGCIKAALRAFSALPLDELLHVHIPNGSLWQFDFEPKGHLWACTEIYQLEAQHFEPINPEPDHDGKLRLA